MGNGVYTYDFGDNWEHLITLEGIIDENRDHAQCTGGKGTTPPEDCGGVWGYTDIKDAFASDDEARKDEIREWLWMEHDEDWDPNDFDDDQIKIINEKLRNLKACNCE